MFSNLPGWLWAIPGIGAAALAFALVRRFGGSFKAALAVAGAIIAAAALKVLRSNAEREGYERAEAEAERDRLDRIERGRRAEEEARRRLEETGGVIDETDPNLRDPLR